MESLLFVELEVGTAGGPLVTVFIPSDQDREGFLYFGVARTTPVGHGGGCCGQRCDAFSDLDISFFPAGFG